MLGGSHAAIGQTLGRGRGCDHELKCPAPVSARENYARFILRQVVNRDGQQTVIEGLPADSAVGTVEHADIGDMLKQSEGARIFFRSAMSTRLSEEEWKKLLQEIPSKAKK